MHKLQKSIEMLLPQLRWTRENKKAVQKRPAEMLYMYKYWLVSSQRIGNQIEEKMGA